MSDIKQGDNGKWTFFIPYGDKWFNRGVCNSSCVGTNKWGNKDGKGRPRANILDNCVGFANGAYNETFVRVMNEKGHSLDEKEYFKFTCDANLLTKRADDFSKHPALSGGIIEIGANEEEKRAFKSSFILPPSAYPPKDGLVVWGGKRRKWSEKDGVYRGTTSVCHTAYIIDVKDKDNIVIAQSGYGYPDWTTEKDGGYYCDVKEVNRNHGAPNLFWYNNGTADVIKGETLCLGFISNPAVGVDSSVSGMCIPEATATQSSTTVVSISGKRNGEPPQVSSTSIYYKWDSGASEDSNDGVLTLYESEFSIDIKKPRSANVISLLLVNRDSNKNSVGSSYITSDLSPSCPLIYVTDAGGNLKEAVPYIYTNNRWNMVVPTTRTGTKWYEIYDTGKERVDN